MWSNYLLMRTYFEREERVSISQLHALDYANACSKVKPISGRYSLIGL